MTLVVRMCRAKSNSQGFLSSSKEGENLPLNLSIFFSQNHRQLIGFNQLKAKSKNTRETPTQKKNERLI